MKWDCIPKAFSALSENTSSTVLYYRISCISISCILHFKSSSFLKVLLLAAQFWVVLLM